MSDVVIRAEGLGKKYIIGHQAERERYTTLRDSMGRSLRNWGRSARDMFAGKALVGGDETEEFWALKNINFEIERGDVVGIIGRNGAGKSTLLKVLSRITEPTQGRVTIDGRVASLLEVGTGFHPELSGRENIYLNGAILGMSREEIRRKFDEIVDFAGVERFLDTPVKRYSSGMYVRLAFAVAAHLEPEILIVDEVLAVGDAEFQKKCLGKMKDVAGHGRTVLFVSHNIAAINSLTKRCLVLKQGEILADCSTNVATELYYAGNITGDSAEYRSTPSNIPKITHIRTNISQSGAVLQSGGLLSIEIDVHLPEEINSPCLSFQIVNSSGVPVIHCWSYDEISNFRAGGTCQFKFIISQLNLNVGAYTLSVYFSEPPGGRSFEVLEGICLFHVEMTNKTTLFGWRQSVCTYLADFECSFKAVSPIVLTTDEHQLNCYGNNSCHQILERGPAPIAGKPE